MYFIQSLSAFLLATCTLSIALFKLSFLLTDLLRLLRDFEVCVVFAAIVIFFKHLVLWWYDHWLWLLHGTPSAELRCLIAFGGHVIRHLRSLCRFHHTAALGPWSIYALYLCLCFWHRQVI